MQHFMRPEPNVEKLSSKYHIEIVSEPFTTRKPRAENLYSNFFKCICWNDEMAKIVTGKDL